MVNFNQLYRTCKFFNRWHANLPEDLPLFEGGDEFDLDSLIIEDEDGTASMKSSSKAINIPPLKVYNKEDKYFIW